MAVDLVGVLEDRAVPAGKLHEIRKIGRRLRDATRRHHRQQAILLAADHQRGHREVVQPDVPLGAKGIDQCARPATTTGRGRLGEQLVDELSDGRVRVPAHGHHRHESLAGPVRRTRQRRRTHTKIAHVMPWASTIG
jgi:hypothetical protein